MVALKGTRHINGAYTTYFKVNRRAARRLALYVSHRCSGRPLRETGERFGMGASGVSQASRRVEAQMASAPELRRVLEEVVKRLGLSQVQT